MEGRMTAVETTVASLDSRVSKIEGKVETIPALEVKLDMMDNNIVEIKGIVKDMSKEQKQKEEKRQEECKTKEEKEKDEKISKYWQIIMWIFTTLGAMILGYFFRR